MAGLENCRVPVELAVSRSIHLAHAPLADEGGDIVVVESGADGMS